MIFLFLVRNVRNMKILVAGNDICHHVTGIDYANYYLFHVLLKREIIGTGQGGCGLTHN